MTERKATNITWHEGEVDRAMRARLLGQSGATLWLTGLSGSGKSTLACALELELLRRGRIAYRLDGDNVRHGLNQDLGFGAEDRAENIRRIGEVARLFADAGVLVVASFLSPYRRDRAGVRQLHDGSQLPFLEIHVSCALDVAESRDPKGLYRKARAGEIKGFTGIDDPYEVPESPDLVVETDRLTVVEGVEQILATLQDRGLVEA